MGEYVVNRVQELRTAAHLTQEELAERAGVSRQTIIAIEKGNYTPSVSLAIKLARIFKTPVEKVFSIVYDA
ncbi:MAG: helix-turn-helix transcriptional regulator [Patescibacteria group bacterium]|nr:helix-turn-helix transcriptional regulator [Patescibacteria group bacterium]